MVYNAMAAALVGSVLGLSSIEIERGVKNLKTIAGRNNIIKENGFTIIDDCYNANPVSMKASLDVLDTAIGRKVAILGSMFELGENEKQMHYDVGMYLGTKDIDVLITAGDLAAQIAAGTRAYIDTNYNAHGCEVHDFETRDDMLKCIGHILKTGDNILIKASHGMEFTKVVEALKTINL
jgi:UDP-N-acetylmuramoyl-tripeptide--D-alanyl-D-alanine ligase